MKMMGLRRDYCFEPIEGTAPIHTVLNHSFVMHVILLLTYFSHSAFKNFFIQIAGFNDDNIYTGGSLQHILNSKGVIQKIEEECIECRIRMLRKGIKGARRKTEA